MLFFKKLSCGFVMLPISFHLRAFTRISLHFLKSLQLWVKKLLIQTANECKSNSNCNHMSSSNTGQAKQTQRLNDFEPVSTEGAAQYESVICWATFIFAVKVGDIIATWWEITAWPCCAEESTAVKALAWVLKLTALLTPQRLKGSVWTKPDTHTEASTITLSLSARAAAQNEAGC